MSQSLIIYTSNPAEQAYTRSYVASYLNIVSEFTFSRGDQNWQGGPVLAAKSSPGGPVFGGGPIFRYWQASGNGLQTV